MPPRNPAELAAIVDFIAKCQAAPLATGWSLSIVTTGANSMTVTLENSEGASTSASFSGKKADRWEELISYWREVIDQIVAEKTA